jgi:hypothetical protein
LKVRGKKTAKRGQIEKDGASKKGGYTLVALAVSEGEEKAKKEEECCAALA